MAGFYQDWIAPRLVDLSMRNKRLVAFRTRVVSAAEGRVLEIGIGSGLNLPFYTGQARQILGLDPLPRLLARARSRVSSNAPVQFLTGSAEQIPLDAGSVDTVVMTWVGCSIPNISLALDEIRRVLRPVICFSSSMVARRNSGWHAGRTVSTRYGRGSPVAATSTGTPMC
jgi:ubiquinone/menaquinone biosynthesis C-methylase UbiE